MTDVQKENYKVFAIESLLQAINQTFTVDRFETKKSIIDRNILSLKLIYSKASIFTVVKEFKFSNQNVESSLQKRLFEPSQTDKSFDLSGVYIWHKTEPKLESTKIEDYKEGTVGGRLVSVDQEKKEVRIVLY